MKLRGSIGKLLLGVLGCLLATLAVAGIRKARVGEATVHAMHKGPAKGTLPHYLKEELEERREAHEREIKLLSRNRQRSTPSLASHEGPRSLAEEKLASRAFPGEGLPLEGAAIGRREMSRLAGFIDEHSNSGRPWESLGPDNAVFPVATSRTNKEYVTSGRISALAIDPRCAISKADKQRDDEDRHCRLFVAAAGGGVWRTDRPFSATPRWEFTSDEFLTNAIGTLAIDPRDPDVILAGTGEPNASADSSAGLGIYRSTDGGQHWRRLSSTLTFPGPTGPVSLADGFNDLSIASIVFDPNRTSTFFVATTLGVRGISATEGGVLSANQAPAGLYKTTDGGSTFTQIWDGGGVSCAPFGDPCLTSWGVDKVELDPTDPSIVYASAVDVGIWRSSPAENGGAFTQVFFSQNQANIGSDRTDFALATLPTGKLRIYAATGATGAFAGFPAPLTSFSQVWRIDDARRPAATLIAEETAVVPAGKPAVPGGWKLLTSPNVGDPRFATFEFCTGQCWYDMGIYTPPGRPDTVLLIGSYNYDEAYGLSNARGVLRSTTAGEPDPRNNNVTFTDLTFDARTPNGNSPDFLTQTTSIHPDQHALVFAPGNPDVWFEGSDGGLVRSSGQYVSISDSCPTRPFIGRSPAVLLTCQRLLSAVPTAIFSLNSGLQTLQFQHLSINPRNPLGELQGGTQDNGTFQFEGSVDTWLESIGGDGGLSGFDASNPTNRFHTFFGSNADINLAGGDPFEWFLISDPLSLSRENVRFYMPIIADPRPDKGGTIFAGLQFVWRTTDNGGDPAFLAANCNEFGPFTNSGRCGDFKRLGNRALTGGTVSFLARTPSDTGTLWASTASGRVYIFKNADAPNPAAAGEFEVSDALGANNTTPVRFISGIAIDPANPNHGWVSYGGYNAVTPVGQRAIPGHVFEVAWDGVAPRAKFTLLDGTGPGALGDLPLNALVRDDLTGDLFVANDFGVLRRDAKSGHWHVAAQGMPMVEVSSLAIDSTNRVLYAATHGRSAFRLRLGNADQGKGTIATR
ncbi:MAG: hypothetical protein ACJ79M_08295 [Myxococcales bacterium]